MTAATFPLGRLVATPGALEAIGRSPVTVFALLQRHSRGDWGDVDADDQRANDRAVNGEERILSAYQLVSGRVWIITEADRSATTLLLPDEY